MQVDLSELDKRVEQGLIARKTRGDLILYNYTDKCQWERQWDDYTRMARGLVVDGAGNVVALPFPKFYNAGEPDCEIPEERYDVFEKVDGSMVAWWWYDSMWNCSTRGSFDNEFTEYASQFWHYLEPFNRELTVITEACLPRELDGMSRAVSHSSGLYLLGARNRVTGEDIHPMTFDFWKGFWPTIHSGSAGYESPLDEVLYTRQFIEGTEGWVVRFHNGYRVKVKTEWYLRLFRAISQLDEKHIKELVTASGMIGDACLSEFPDELRQEAITIFNQIHVRYANKLNQLDKKFSMFYRESRKDFALGVRDDPDSKWLFQMYDNRDISLKLFSEV